MERTKEHTEVTLNGEQTSSAMYNDQMLTTAAGERASEEKTTTTTATTTEKERITNGQTVAMKFNDPLRQMSTVTDCDQIVPLKQILNVTLSEQTVNKEKSTMVKNNTALMEESLSEQNVGVRENLMKENTLDTESFTEVGDTLDKKMARRLGSEVREKEEEKEEEEREEEEETCWRRP